MMGQMDPLPSAHHHVKQVMARPFTGLSSQRSGPALTHQHASAELAPDISRIPSRLLPLHLSKPHVDI